MSKENKKKSDNIELTPETEATVSYADWFAVKLKDHKKLQAHHYPVILSFFKKNNLTELESESKYDSMLKKFGY